MFTSYEVGRNRNIAGGFFNRITHRKNETGYVEEAQDQIGDLQPALKEIDAAASIAIDYVWKNTNSGGKTTVKFIFNLDGTVGAMIDEIRNATEKASGWKLPSSTTHQDMIREALMFVVGNSRNGLWFFTLTYLGVALGLGPLESLMALSAASRMETEQPGLASYFAANTKKKLVDLSADSVQIQEFIFRIEELKTPELALGLEESEKFISESNNKLIDVNYFSAFQGFTLASIAIKLRVFSPVLLFVGSSKIRGISSKKLFLLTLRDLLKLATLVSGEK